MRLRNPQTREELEKVCRLTAESFGEDEKEEMYAFMLRAFLECPYLTPDLCYVMDVEGEIAASAQILPLEMQVGGGSVRVAGLQAIVVDPRFRSASLVKEAFQKERERTIQMGFDFTLGFGHARFFDRLGAAPLVGDTIVLLRTRDIQGSGSDNFRAMGPEDTELLLRHYAEANAGRTGVIRRTPEYWTWARLKPPHFRIRDDGYVGYEIKGDEVNVLEINGESQAFYRDALREVAGVAKLEGVEHIRIHVPPDHPFVESVLPFGAEVRTSYWGKNHERKRGWCLGAILNAPSFFGKLEGELASRLQRALPESPGIDLTIRTDDETVQLAFPGKGGEHLPIELALPRKLLTQLAMGYKGPDTVLLEAGVKVDAERLQVLRVLFPKGHPYVWRSDRF